MRLLTQLLLTLYFLFCLHVVCFNFNLICVYCVYPDCRVLSYTPSLAALAALAALVAVKRGCPAHTFLATNTDTPMTKTGTTQATYT